MFYRAGPGSGFRVTDLVGTPRNHTDRRGELVDRLSQRLVLTRVARAPSPAKQCNAPRDPQHVPSI